MKLRHVLFLTVSPAASFIPWVPAAEPAPAGLPGETTLQLDIGFGIRAVPPARVTVPAGDTLRLLAPRIGDGFSHTWLKNGRALPGATESSLVLLATAAAAGAYSCQLSASGAQPLPSQAAVIGVGPTDRLLNLSSRSVVGGTNADLVAGFVVAANSAGKKLIVRAIGPSLALFGMTNVLRAPVLRIFDGNGKPYENGYAYPAVVGGLTYETDLADSLARAGAFPVPAGTRDVVVMMPFVPGSYTAQVSSADGTSGAVLLEVYEVP